MKGLTVFATIAAALALAAPARADCTVTIGVVMELTGPAGEYGQAGAKSVEMAFRDLNDAGGPHGCKLVADTRNSQSQGALAVDAANQLVQLKKVPVIIGGIISSVSIPILTSVTGPDKIVQVSPASSSPTLTNLGRDGKTQRHVLPHHHLGRAAGNGGGQICAGSRFQETRGHPRQQRFRRQHAGRVLQGLQSARRRDRLGLALQREAVELRRRRRAKGIAAKPDGLYLIATPVDGATIARAWICQGGPAKFLLNDGMNSPDFITSVGAKYLNEAYGTSSGTSPTASTEYFNDNYKAFSGGIDPSNPAADRAYDAGAIVGLAVAAGRRNARRHPRRHLQGHRQGRRADPRRQGRVRASALDLLKAGKPIRYEGVIGPISFDAYGDITGPFRLWKITDGKVTTTGEMSTTT